MDCLTTVFVSEDVPGKPRRDKPCQVLMQLSRFDNLCPLYSDRQLLRMMLGRGDDLSSSSYLLSPLDAARLSQSMLILPRQERDLTVFKASLTGAPVSILFTQHLSVIYFRTSMHNIIFRLVLLWLVLRSPLRLFTPTKYLSHLH